MATTGWPEAHSSRMASLAGDICEPLAKLSIVDLEADDSPRRVPVSYMNSRIAASRRSLKSLPSVVRSSCGSPRA